MQHVSEINEQLASQITELAAQTAIQMFQKTKDAAEREEKSKRLHNTKRLMRHYVELKEYVNKIDASVKGVIVPKIAVDKSENIIDLITFGDDIVSSLKKSTQATLKMIQHLDNALETLEYIYAKENDIASYKMLQARYIDKLKIEQIMELHHMSKRNVYKVLDKVLERLSVLLFGVYAIKIT